MTLVLANMLIAILMMGYETARIETIDSASQMAFNKNVGSFIDVAKEWFADIILTFKVRWLDRLRRRVGLPSPNDRPQWTETDWDRAIAAVVERGHRKGINLVNMSLMTLTRTLREAGCGKGMASGDMLRMCLQRYTHRVFEEPPDKDEVLLVTYLFAN